MTSAYVFIQISSRNPFDTLSSVQDIEGVKQAHLVLGPTDIIAFVEVADMEMLGEAIMAMQVVDGIAHTDTRLVVSV